MIAIRPFHEVDDPRLDGLLDAAPDPLWRSQGHRLHGPDRDGATWRRTVIVEDDGLVVGAGTIAVNAVHPTRYNAAVEVAPDHRRRGIGASLLSALRRLRSEPLPLAGKVGAGHRGPGVRHGLWRPPVPAVLVPELLVELH